MNNPRRNIYILESDWCDIQERASSLGMSVSGYLRRLSEWDRMKQVDTTKPQWLQDIDHSMRQEQE